MVAQPVFVAGYPAERLDPVLVDLVGVVEQAGRELADLLPMLGKVRTRLTEVLGKPVTADAVAEARAAVDLVEKSSRVLTQVTRTVDSLTRLRSFVTGGPDHRTEDMKSMSDRQLMAMILSVVGRCPRCGAELAGAA
jgi:hypothetical protein